jgi:putative transposase
MFNFLIILLHSILKIFASNRKDLILTMMILKKENQIYKRQLNLKKVQSSIKKNDRLFISLIFQLSKRATNHLTLVKPSTLLDWQRRFIKNYWTYKHKPPGRKSVSREIKNLILQMKNDNQLWGCYRIADELKKIGIKLHPTTVNKIIQTFRKQGKIQPNGSWRKFLKSHWESLFGMDFMTVDTLFGKRFYLFIILELNSRRIIRFDLTSNPCREFVKQRIALFSEDFSDQKVTIIHDNAAQFTSIDYGWFGIKGVNICSYAPNMNAYVERLNGSIRREALDHFLLFSEKQIRKIIREYVDYHNYQRPHQGLGKIPNPEPLSDTGSVCKTSVLGGLHHSFYRSSA